MQQILMIDWELARDVFAIIGIIVIIGIILASLLEAHESDKDEH